MTVTASTDLAPTPALVLDSAAAAIASARRAVVAERYAGGPGPCTGSVSACTPETLILPNAGVSGGGLTSVPEPSSIALFGSGLLALFGLSRSLKRKSIEVA